MWSRVRLPAAIAAGAVAAVFLAATGVSWLLWKPPAELVRPVKPAPPPMAALPSPPPAISEPEPGSEPFRDEPPATTTPAAATLPPPLPPPAGTPAWRRHAQPFTLPAGTVPLAVVIDDMGLDRGRSTRMARLPGPLTLSWLPYAKDLATQTRAAREAGHELLLHMPMEPQGHADPGPDALRAGLDPGEVARRVDAALTAFPGMVGLNNHMGSRFTERRDGMAAVAGVLRQKGLLWLDSRTTPRSVGSAVAAELGVPHAERDVFLDNVQTVEAVRGQLARLEASAKAHGHAVAIGHPHDATIEALRDWLPTLASRGFALAPVSALAK
jgi:uncharacterized protein